MHIHIILQSHSCIYIYITIFSSMFSVLRVMLRVTHVLCPTGHVACHSCSLSYRSCCVSLMFSVLQVMLRVTPLREGELDVLGFIYNLCVEPGAPVKGSESPQTASCRANLPSLTISSKDSLYQRHKSSGVQHSLAEGVQVHACTLFHTER